ncbi:Preprotein translocase subunit SecY [Psychromonas sp. Urea-02u-13]|uniref:Preprotein translocase subunit SecY n=1 Tax=Psychromonas sp. Urea-02u-13 TaxID=2058326 RepID=UPI000C344B1A|nr:Preprotein translocase subunit SecY [Psychromonas sp. Urea-02u-13]PKG40945.1 Preprotein translocase subunit SecY [Psychromonas sp. Urea-02u-13]
MIEPSSKRLRHAKGPFAMTVVYSFTGASILASIIFSLLLFLSIDNDPWMQFLFGALAVIFELGKFFAWYEFGERLARRNLYAAVSAFTFYSILAAISIGGSIGGINSATNTAQRHVDSQQNKSATFDLQINAIEKQIDLNNLAAQKYIDLNRIATGVARIQTENTVLREQQLTLAIERDRLPVASQGSVFGLIGSVATALNIDAKTAQLSLVIFLSVLLDLFAAFFVGLIGEELRFSRTLKAQQQTKNSNKKSLFSLDNNEDDSDNGLPTELELAKTEASDLPRNEDLIVQAIALLSAGDIRCSKKALADKLLLNAEDTDLLFSSLLQQGLVTQKPNRHFVWQGDMTQSLSQAA